MTDGFDALARAMGAAPSRRSALKLLGGAIVAATFGRFQPAAAAGCTNPGEVICGNVCCSSAQTNIPGQNQCCSPTAGTIGPGGCCAPPGWTCCLPFDTRYCGSCQPGQLCNRFTGDPSTVSCVTQCPAGQTQCGNYCCGTGETCDPSTGTCVGGCGSGGTACPSGQTCCGNTCVDTSSDPSNCGGCGNVCPNGQHCANGKCATCATLADCPLGQDCCNGVCIDTSSDANNCGACGVQCDPNKVCQSGQCVCASGTTTCGTNCCPPGRACDPTTNTCVCPQGSASCGSGCCPSGRTCDQGLCCDEPGLERCVGTCMENQYNHLRQCVFGCQQALQACLSALSPGDPVGGCYSRYESCVDFDCVSKFPMSDVRGFCEFGCRKQFCSAAS